MHSSLVPLHLLLRDFGALAQQTSSGGNLIAHFLVLLLLRARPLGDSLTLLETLLGITEHSNVASFRSIRNIMPCLQNLHFAVVQRDLPVACLMLDLRQQPLLLARSMMLLAQLLREIVQLSVDRLNVALQVRGLLARLAREHALGIHFGTRRNV